MTIRTVSAGGGTRTAASDDYAVTAAPANTSPFLPTKRGAEIVSLSIFVIAVVFMTAHLAWIGSDAGGEQRAFIANLFNLPVPLLATGVAFWVSLSPGVDGRTRRAWWLISGGLASYFLGNLFWLIYENVLETPPTSTAVDLIYLLNYPLLLAGLLTFPVVAHRPYLEKRFWLDTAAIVVAGVMALWYIVLQAAEAVEYTTFVDRFLAVGYPVGDVVLVFGGAAVMLRMPGANLRMPLTLLALGNFAMFVADLGYGHILIDNGEYISGMWPDGLYGLGGFFWLMSPLAFQRSRRIGRADRSFAKPAASSVGPPAHRVSFLPYVAIALGYAMLLYVSRDRWGEPLGGIILGAIVLTGIVVARQIVAVRDSLAHESRFRSLVQRSSDLITVVSASGVIRYQSPSLAWLFGLAPDGVIDRPLAHLAHVDDLGGLSDAIESASIARNASLTHSWRLIDAEGNVRQVESLLTNLIEDASVRGIVLNTRDVTERASLEQQLTYQAFHDPLTGLPNRARVRERLAQMLAAARHAGHPARVCVLVLDLDGFKTVNDSLGHAAGDRLLNEVAARLLNATRGSDMVARLGGDEFAILLEDMPSDEDANLVAERVLGMLRTPFDLDASQVVIGASIGIARSHEVDPSVGSGDGSISDQIDILIRNADTAMYGAKTGGKGRFAWFEPGMHRAAVARLTLEADLRDAIEREEFVLRYQPIVRLDTGEVQGVEALVRWQHPTRGPLNPGEFIQIAEDTGLIVGIGRLVLAEACRTGAEWQGLLESVGSDGRPLSVTVNVSSRQLDDPGFYEDVRSTLERSGLVPSSLVLELTESTMITNPEMSRVRLLALRELGVRFAIDDFGTGYSSLSYLQHFPIDLLKIDRSFIDRLTRGGSDASLVSAIVALGASLSLKCIAEGIEVDDQQQALLRLGCEFGQGYLFGRPMPAEDLTLMLLDRSGVAEEVAIR